MSEPKRKSSMKSAWYVALAVVAIFFLARSGGLAALAPFYKFLFPIGILVYAGYRLKKKILPIKQAFDEIQKQQHNAKYGGSEGPTIEICPKCGFEKGARGTCRC
jgi:hypothetical protein